MSVRAKTMTSLDVDLAAIDRARGFIYGCLDGEERVWALSTGELLTGETLTTSGYDLDLTSFDQEEL